MTERIVAADGPAFRAWLDANHETSDAVWLVYYKKGSSTPSIDWPEAVDEALCYGWIDSKVRSLDDERHEQYFSRRKPGSAWSKRNKERIETLDAAGRLRTAGHAAIERAKADGSWTLLDAVEALMVPDDLADALSGTNTGSAYESLTKSRRKAILYWVTSAKRPDTRARRIDATVDALRRGEAPNNF